LINYKLDLSEIENLYTTKGHYGIKWLKMVSIPTIIIMVVIAGFLKFIPVKIEGHTIILVGFIYVIYLFFMKHNATLSVCRFESNFDLLKLKIKEYLNDRIFVVDGKIKALASMDDFFTNYKRGLQNDNYASVGSSIFPTLGILGTFISIAVSMPDFTSSGKDASDFEQEITILLGGISTAFYVSIYGIFLSLWWTFFEKGGLSKFEDNVRELKKICMKFTWKKDELELAKFEEEQNRHKEMLEVISKNKNDDFIEDFNRAMIKRMQLFEELMESENKAFVRATEGINELLNSTAINSKIHQNLVSQIELFSKEMNEIGYTLSKNTALADNIIHRMDKKEKNIEDRLESFANSAKSIAFMLSTSKKTIDNEQKDIVKSVKMISERLSEFTKITTKQNNQLSNNFTEFNENMRVSSKSFTKAFDSPNIENLKHIYSLLLKEFENLNYKIEEIPENFAKTLGKYDEIMVGKLRNSLGVMDDELALIVEKLAIVLKSIDRSSQNIERSLRKQNEKL